MTEIEFDNYKNFITVVIPVYNGERYISDTIESLKNQTYKNFEVIIIDDCSQDNSVQIIKNKISDDKRFKLIEKHENAGNAVKNIEYAMQFCKGEWFFYMSHDDLIDPDFFEKSLKKSIETGADCVIPNMLYYYPGMKAEEMDGTFPPDRDYEKVLSNIEAFKLSIYWDNHAFHLKKMSIVKNLPWNSHLMAGDEILNRLYFYYSNKIVFVDTNFYYNQENDEAITKAVKPRLLEYVECYLKLVEFMYEHKNEFDKKTINKCFKHTAKLLKCYRNLFEENYSLLNKEEKVKIDKYYKELKIKLLKTAFKIKNFSNIDRILKYSHIRKFRTACSTLSKRLKVDYSPLHLLGSSRLKIAFYDGCPDNICDRYRVKNIVEGLTNHGIIADIYYKENISKLIYSSDYNLLVIFRSGFIDKEYLSDVKNLIKIYKNRGIKVVYDVDDLLLEKKFGKTSEIVQYFISECDAATTTTNALAKEFKKINPNVFVIKNTINQKQYQCAKNIKTNQTSKEIKIVYQCGTNTHNKDFKECSAAMVKILTKYKNVRLHIVGHPCLGEEFNELKNQVKFIKYMNYINLLKYVSKMDINIAPLVVNRFNNCKSELKIFESALVKIPSVVSPIEPYSNTIIHGQTGFIAHNSDDWEKYLSILIENETLRKEMGKNAYKEIVPKFYIGNEIKNAIEVYKKILELKNNEKEVYSNICSNS